MDTFVVIPNFPDYYINRNGDVLSRRYPKERILKPKMEKNGYYRICLVKNKIRKYMLVHRLLALTFISNDNNLPCVDHIDRCKTNNSISNLRWVTHITNSQNVTRHKDNKTGHKNICFTVDKRNGNERYKVQIIRNGKQHQKLCKTLEETIKYRNEYLKNLGEEIID